MSKKVLNYAGRRPMLLALIMATLTFGLLFSGWLTPTPGRAQTGGGNSSSGTENTNCPNYTTNVSVSCPAITNGEDLSPLSFCVVLGDSLPDPAWTSQPGATPGSVVTTITETCSNVVTSATNTITYGFSWYYETNQNNPTGKPPTPTKAGTYSATAIGVITSSDTNACQNPSAPTWGVTWTVVDGGIDAGSIKGSANNGGQTWKPDWQAGLKDIIDGSGAGAIFVLNDPTADVYLTHNWWKQQHCCTNGSTGNINKIWETGSASIKLGGSYDFTVISFFPDWSQNIINYLGSLPGYTGQLGNITGIGHFSAENTATASGNTTIYTSMEDDCYGCNASYITGDCNFNANINDAITNSLFGHDVKIYITGYFTSDLKTYGIKITPPDPANQMKIYLQDYITYSLYAYAKIWSWGPGGKYWIEPDSAHVPNPAKVINTVCITPNL